MSDRTCFTDWRNRSEEKPKMEDQYPTYERSDGKVVTDGGQEIVLNDAFSAGKSWAGAERPSTVHTRSDARTTFSARRAPNERQYNRLWKLQHRRGHTYEAWGSDQRVRVEDIDKYDWACIVLSRAEVTEFVRTNALRRVMTEPLQGFSRYFAGTYGATLGFACLYQFNTPSDAKESAIANLASEILEEQGAEGTADRLIDYVWSNYESDY